MDRIRSIKFISILFFLILFSVSAFASQIKSVRVWPEPTKVRLVLDLSQPLTFKQFTLENPERLVIDIPSGQFRADVSQIQWPNPISSFRYAQHDATTLRLVIDLKNKVNSQVFLLSANEQYGDRLVIDLLTQTQSTSIAPVPVIAQPTITAEPTPRIPEKTVKKDFIIAIDAGHGGEDPGAIGPKGTHEKNIVLSISNKLAELIRKEKGMKPVLVRSGDYFIPLRQRMTIARGKEADLFISIHADAFRDPRANGASVYTLSQSGASSEAARWLAEQENRSDLIGGVSLNDKDDMLASVLLDLSQTASTKASVMMGSAVLQQLGGITRLHSKQVQNAGFAVLKSPDIPSILVETGFISNPENERNLRTGAYQEKIAKAILVGIKQYMRSSNQYNDLPSLYMADMTHTIQRGETLSDIAARYQVSVSTLRTKNKLKNDELRIGQVLQIPPG